MKIVTIPPEEYFKMGDPFAVDRWMCTRCGLLLDYQFDPEDHGWPRFEPPLQAHYEWIDEEGEIQIDEPERDEFCPRCSLDFQSDPPAMVDIGPMTRIEDLEKIISRGEDGSMEFKREFPASADRLANIVTSFANTNGGKILFGVADDGSMVGFQEINSPIGKDGFRQRVRGLLGRIQPKLEVRIDFYSDGSGIDVAVVTVPRGPHAIYLSGTTCDGYLTHPPQCTGFSGLS